MGYGYIDKTNRFIYGTLCKNQVGNFIYCCSRCSLEFTIITDLEAHTFAHATKQADCRNTKNYCKSYELKTLRILIDRMDLKKSTINNEKTIEESTNKYELIESAQQVHNGKCNQLPAIEASEKNIDKTPTNANVELNIKNPAKGVTKRKFSLTDNKGINRKNGKRQKRFHTYEMPYECFICHSRYKQSSCLCIHMKIHSGDNPFICTICRCPFASFDLLKYHTDIHLDRPFKCNQCNDAFRQQIKLNQHISRVHEKEIKRKPTKATTKKRENLIKSIGIKLSENSKERKKPAKNSPKIPIKSKQTYVKCAVCDKTLTRASLKCHLMIHTGERPYECFICHSTHRQYSHLEIHMKIHSGDKPFICAICGFTCSSRSSLMKHVRKHGDKLFKCNQCDCAYRHQYKLNAHMSAVHEKMRRYQCDLCGKKFSGTDGKSQHMRTHAEKQFSCRFCERKFTYNSNRCSHEKRVHQVT